MANFRDSKIRVREALEQTDWQQAVEALEVPPLTLINVLLACLPQGSPFTERAAKLIGEQVSWLAANAVTTEQARMFVRRLVWHMNEESGNIGWGIPEAFGAVLAKNRSLAEQFHKVLISYVLETGTCDNYCDHPVLRLSCYGAVQALVEAWPDLGEHARFALVAGARADSDEACRAAAARALQRLNEQTSEKAGA